ncbi:hypothetical protein JHK84_031495 [Glycine max]|nr:hypothetical protein JHK85_031916 [Glycine max]KAG5145952.1 hypothetical protein JHK84_031495 [Glycine max]
MDYDLAALKLFCSQLKQAREVAMPCQTQSQSQSSFTLGGLLFQRPWLQGVLVSASDAGSLLLDDGTDLVELSLNSEFRHRPWKLGNQCFFSLCSIQWMYVMVVGGYAARPGKLPMIKVHKIVDLSSSPNREAMWYLEVMEAYKLFYQPLVEEFT